MLLTDTIALDGVRRTGDGYLVASARVARTGVQIYSGAEVGKPEMGMVRVYRPETEVFSKDALKSFAHRPVTLDHPPEMVTAENWGQYAKGYTADEIARDGECIRVPLLVADSATIDAIEAGKRELSMGYLCDLKWEPGKTEAGEQYDAVQTGIRANHLAVVTAARGGSHLRIGDEGKSKGDHAMADKPLKTVTVDGLSIEVTDQGAQVIEKLQKQLSDTAAAKATVDTKVAELTTTVANKDAEIATLKKQVEDAKVTPQKLRDAAKSFSFTVDVAKKLAPSLAITDSMDEPAIMKAVVAAKLGDVAKDWNDAQIAISFATLAKDVKVESPDPLRAGIMHVQPIGDANDAAKTAHDAYVKRLTSAWKGETKAA